MATVGTLARRGSQALPGFSSMKPSRSSTAGMWEWPYTTTRQPGKHARGYGCRTGPQPASSFFGLALQDKRAARRRVPGFGLQGDGHALHVRKVRPDLQEGEAGRVRAERLDGSGNVVLDQPELI